MARLAASAPLREARHSTAISADCEQSYVQLNALWAVSRSEPQSAGVLIA